MGAAQSRTARKYSRNQSSCAARCPGFLTNPHAIPVTVKPIACCQRVTVRPQNQLAPSEPADQHKQRGLGQMKIRQQLVDHSESMTWLDKNDGNSHAALDEEIPV